MGPEHQHERVVAADAVRRRRESWAKVAGLFAALLLANWAERMERSERERRKGGKTKKVFPIV